MPNEWRGCRGQDYGCQIPVAYNGPGLCVHDLVNVNKGLDADSGSLAVVSDLLVANADAVQVIQRLRGFSVIGLIYKGF